MEKVADMNVYLVMLLSALMAFTMVNWVYFKILKIAKDKNLVDNPDARKLQKKPVPVLGGIAVFFGVIFGVLVAFSLAGVLPDVMFRTSLLPILAAMMVMIYVGAIDDILSLGPRSRLLIEVFAVVALVASSGGCVDTLHGLWGVEGMSLWLAVPLTVVAGVGIVNAINMIDGVNGLSSGLCMMCSVLFGFVFVRSGDWSNAVLAFVMAASLLPFYVHNVFGDRSRMFIGDAGTMAVGMLLTWFVMEMLRSDNTTGHWADGSGVGLVAMVLAFLSVPVADTLRVMTMRMAHGKSPFAPDKNHLHHVFIAAGISHVVTSTIIIGINLLITLVWVLSVGCGLGAEAQFYVVVGVSMLLVWGTFAFVRYNERRHTDFMCRLSYYSNRTHWEHKDWWKAFSRWLDAPDGVVEAKEGWEAEARSSVRKNVVDMENYKQADRKKVIEFLKGKAGVSVENIIENSGAEKLRIYPILFEFEQEGIIEVVKRQSLGAPDIVRLKG